MGTLQRIEPAGRLLSINQLFFPGKQQYVGGKNITAGEFR